ncbi:L-threonylcarbamoyladenylate synthase [Roseicitreum antarcticum]
MTMPIPPAESPQLQTERLRADPAGIARAAALLAAGGLVALPTETVYGLAADARSDLAVAGVFAAKGRPRFNPLIVHLADAALADQYGVLDGVARRLAQAFWPGPLTLIVPLRDGHGLSPLVTAGLASVALRVPAHGTARAVLAAFGGPLAAPSANPSGRISPTTAAHVLAGLDGRIAAVLDGGACGVGVESTIIGLTDGVPRLLRAGGLASEAVEAAMGARLHPALPVDDTRPTAPGQLSSHYAPGAAVLLGMRAPRAGVVWVGFGAGCDAADMTLSASGDLTEAAANLFATLHRADALARSRGAVAIGFAPVPDTGLGRAINDRLSRAAAPRG